MDYTTNTSVRFSIPGDLNLGLLKLKEPIAIV